MVSKFAATVFAALGLTGAPQGHGTATLHGYSRSEHSAARQALPAIFVTGHGWGHGVGLAQYGTYGYALHGWSADKIVAHYFSGTTLGEAQLKRVRVLLAASARNVSVSSTSKFTLVDGAGKKHKLAAGAYSFGPDLKLKLKAAGRARALKPPLFFQPGATPLSLGCRLDVVRARAPAAASRATTAGSTRRQT